MQKLPKKLRGSRFCKYLGNLSFLWFADGHHNASWSHCGGFNWQTQAGGYWSRNWIQEGWDQQWCQITVWLPWWGGKVRFTYLHKLLHCFFVCFFLTDNHSQSYYTLKIIFIFLRFLNSKPQTPSPKPNSLSGPEDQQSPQAKQAPSSPSEWTSFLCAAMKEERLKTDSSCLAMTEAEQGELYETIRHALHSLRKHKASVT